MINETIKNRMKMMKRPVAAAAPAVTTPSSPAAAATRRSNNNNLSCCRTTTKTQQQPVKKSLLVLLIGFGCSFFYHSFWNYHEKNNTPFFFYLSDNNNNSSSNNVVVSKTAINNNENNDDLTTTTDSHNHLVVPVSSNNNSSSIDNDNNDDNRSALPSFENGGILVYFHIPKTGGTTIRYLTKYRFPHVRDGRKARRSSIDYYYITSPNEYQKIVPLMDRWVVDGGGGGDTSNIDGGDNDYNENNNKIIRMLEIHPLHEGLSFVSIWEQLVSWKRQAKQNHRDSYPMFVFTLVRDPVPYAWSFYHFYHDRLLQAKQDRDKQLQQQSNFQQQDQTTTSSNIGNVVAMTKEERDEYRFFQEMVPSDPQTFFLYHNEKAFFSSTITTTVNNNNDINNTTITDENDGLYRMLRETMDWIGTTEEIHNTTLFVLHKMLSTHNETRHLIRKEDVRLVVNRAGAEEGPTHNTHNNSLLLYSDPAVRTSLESFLRQQKTRVDRRLYDAIRNDYSIYSWNHFSKNESYIKRKRKKNATSPVA